MIRWRQPRDDKGIVELVRTQLVPISPWRHPKDGRLHAEIVKRLRRGETLVAVMSGKGPPAGFLHLEYRQPVLFVDLLAVDSRYQNRRLGSELMRYAEWNGIRRGCTVSRVFVDESNARGLRFYHRLGYYTTRHSPALKIVEVEKPLFLL